jgi:hypothetical protein
VQVLLAGADGDVEVAEPARGDVEGRPAAREHVGVEDHGGVGAALVRLEVVDDRVAARLLLAVAGEAQVDRQRALPGEALRRLQQEEELALVVRDAATQEPLALDGRVERGHAPELERVGRLDVEMPVAEDGRRTVRVLRRADLTDRERRAFPVGQLGRPAGRAQLLAQPFARPPDVVGVRRVGGDARDADPLRQLLDQLGCHGGGAYTAEWWPVAR